MQIVEMGEEYSTSVKELILLFKKERGSQVEQEQLEELESLLAMLLRAPEAKAFVAVADGKVVGFVNCHFCPFPLLMGLECYISDLLVHPDYRGRSIGEGLLTTVRQLAESKGIKRLMLNNSKKSEAYSRSFYIKNGFRERDGFANFVKSL
jgi:GNAT superfamily N-acetyltransferase